MAYDIAEIFLTLQGEGHWSGRAAVFCRFARCNLWNGDLANRSRAVCQFCDTDFTATEHIDTAVELADRIEALWPAQIPGSWSNTYRMVVLTGGEPLLQVNQPLLAELHRRRFYVAVETNGTRKIPNWITDRHAFDWVCVSPKSGTVLRVTEADEIKVVWPQPGLDMVKMSDFPAAHHWLSPMDTAHLGAGTGTIKDHIASAINYCKEHPQWRLNIQTHKQIGIR